MFRKTIVLALALSLCLALTVRAEITDMMGRTVALTAPATRIIALEAADCEILCAIGAESALIARGEYCDYPASVLDLPVVQSGANTNLEEILLLEPQAIIMPAMAQTREQVEALENAGIPVIVTNAQSIEDTYDAIRLIGEVAGLPDAANALVEEMRSTFAQIAAQSGDSGKTVYFEVSPLQWGLWTAGAGTFMDEIASLCGLTNAFGDVTGWAQISEEQVLARNPDYIVTITMYYGEDLTPEDEICQRAGWETLTAVQRNAVLRVDADQISRPGPRLTDAAKALLSFISPSAE